MMRRSLLSRLASLPFFALGATQAQAQAPPKKLKIMMKSAWGPDDPTRAAFPFAHGLVLAEAGHDVQIFLLAEATSLLRKSMVNAILPVGWPPLSETLDKVVAKHIPVFA
jgi:predicted peroxiredoxin